MRILRFCIPLQSAVIAKERRKRAKHWATVRFQSTLRNSWLLRSKYITGSNKSKVQRPMSKVRFFSLTANYSSLHVPTLDFGHWTLDLLEHRTLDFGHWTL